ncbi:hypothetical protein GCK72_007234 [Caenorhabditis remanei]|uniref:G-protein coupled receptors family 1 profile domain-containing protein n=1 Tax=Caenorhabditis remanei TaxID=31234 RepID=A0A6A5HII9_CAERE|nr:hypothetical protein GCK72_007234 [Caenorhabditis remanei]KAF1767275.1 hypothetical protein GCK72_007234 [Caenorhabditis remanei]
MPFVAVSVSLSTIVCSIYTVIINVSVLYCTFISKSLIESSNLVLFYVRFAVDGLVAAMSFVLSMFTFNKLFDLDSYLVHYQFIILCTGWINNNIMSIRAVLVIVITFDRTFAVFLPITYHKSRQNLSNSVIVVLVSCYPIVCNIVLWIICDYIYEFIPGCVTFGCLMNQCYVRYALSFELVTHSIIASISLILAIKLFVWNHCTTNSKSKDIERANYIALIDTFIIIVFDIIPSTFIAMIPPETLKEYGLLYTCCRMCGYAIEGFLVQRALKRRKRVVSNLNNSTSQQVAK